MALATEETRAPGREALHLPAHAFGRYALTGFAAAGVDFSLFWALTRVLRFDPLVAHLISRPAGGLTCFLLNRRFTFRATGAAVPGQLLRFGCVFGASLLLTEGLLALFVRGMGLPPVPAKALAEAIVFLFNFTALKHWTFRCPT